MTAIPEGPWLPTANGRSRIDHWPILHAATGQIRATCGASGIALDPTRAARRSRMGPPPRAPRRCAVCIRNLLAPPRSRYEGDPALRHVRPGERAAVHVWEEWLDLGVEQGLSRQTVARTLRMTLPAFERALYRHASRTGQSIPRWTRPRAAA